MGIFDDAIREHLELKRRAGASGDDLDRLEKEAFGGGPPPPPPPEAGSGIQGNGWPAARKNTHG
jgi:hypothetical protein